MISSSSQLTLFAGETEKSQIVNVASVPQRSPFRYPGGKTWLVPTIRKWLKSLSLKPSLFVEPFVGGGIVSLTVGFEQLSEHVLMSELDKGVSAVWRTILNPSGAKWLAQRIIKYELSREGCEEDLKAKPKSLREQAFLTILRNRVSRGGILAKGAGFIEYGENGKGVHSRWYPETLKNRILAVNFLRNRFTFQQRDAFDVIKEHSNDSNAVFFFDPPYTASTKKAGSRLYTHFALDHRDLFKAASACKGDILFTYDNAPELEDLAKGFGFETHLVAMKNNHHAEMNELLIGRDLSWCFN